MARDPDRIPRILALIEEAWKRCPDQRLGQLLSNVAYGPGGDTARLFYLEDEGPESALEAKLTDFLKPNPPRPEPEPVGLPLIITCPNPACSKGHIRERVDCFRVHHVECRTCRGKGEMPADSITKTILRAHVNWITNENRFVLGLVPGYCASCCDADNRYAGQECRNCPGKVCVPAEGL